MGGGWPLIGADRLRVESQPANRSEGGVESGRFGIDRQNALGQQEPQAADAFNTREDMADFAFLGGAIHRADPKQRFFGICRLRLRLRGGSGLLLAGSAAAARFRHGLVIQTPSNSL